MMNLTKNMVLIALVATLAATCGCDSLFTEAPPAGDDLDSPVDGLDHELTQMFLRGDENIEKVFSIVEGLGPIFNNMSCGGCHPGDGRGTPTEALIRFSIGSDLAEGLGGPQLQDRAIPGVQPELLPAGVDFSVRLPPPVFGVGLIEHIPVATILANADSSDADGDSISGRANWVMPPAFVPAGEVGGGGGVQLGRFSRKAQVSSLIEQVSAAYQQDMGITSDFIPAENPNPQAGGAANGDGAGDPEIPSNIVLETVVYVRLLAPPARGEITPQVAQGEAIFASIGCVKCHVPSMKTGPSTIAPLNNVDVNLYSDLLLHDMGPGLADNRPDGGASGSEWRTAPLWGTRLVADFLGGTPFFLHDGRTSDLREAILLHGGEAQGIRDAFNALSGADQDAVLEFVRSL